MHHMAVDFHIYFPTKKDVDLIRKAAKAENRSVSMFIALASINAAKATLAIKDSSVFEPAGALRG